MTTENSMRIRLWRQANLEYVRAYARADYVRTRESRLAKKREYYQKILKARNRTEEGRLKERIKKENRRGLGYVAEDDWRAILEHYGHACAYCRVQVGLEMDHIIPLSKGGLHNSANIVPACKPCNASRGNHSVWPPRLARVVSDKGE